MSKRHWAALGLAGLVGWAGSLGCTTSVSGGGCAEAAVNHRPAAVACAPSTPPMACTTDTDCVAGGVGMTQNGKCVMGSCDFNQCVTDADCPGGQVCSCQGQTRAWAGASYGSVCIPANCRVDADCGKDAFCSPTVSAGYGSFYGTQGFYCHTCEDTCVNDSDCPTQNGRPGYCAFDPTVGHWTCDYVYGAG